MRRIALGRMIASACGSPTTSPLSNGPARGAEQVVRKACPCEERGRVPATLAPDVEARWRRVARAIEPAYMELGALLDRHMCKTRNADLKAILDKYDAALREGDALDAASCDQFTAWRLGWCPCKGILEMVKGLRACGERDAFGVWDRIANMVLARFPCTTPEPK